MHTATRGRHNINVAAPALPSPQGNPAYCLFQVPAALTGRHFQSPFRAQVGVRVVPVPQNAPRLVEISKREVVVDRDLPSHIRENHALYTCFSVFEIPSINFF